MSHCKECLYFPLKNKLDKGTESFFNVDGSRREHVFLAFGLCAEHFSKTSISEDCPLGDNGCPAKFREAVKKYNQLQQK